MGSVSTYGLITNCYVPRYAGGSGVDQTGKKILGGSVASPPLESRLGFVQGLLKL